MLFAVAACSREPPAPVFFEEGYPERLSDWRLMRAENGVLTLNNGVAPYDLATPLFSDYALKLRTITLPKGKAAVYDPDDVFDLPVGTILSKTFYYPQVGEAWSGDVTYGHDPAAVAGAMPLTGLRLIETRLLVHRAEGWVAIPYVWNEAQTDAELKRAGEIEHLVLHRPDGRKEAFAYLVPSQNQCAGCHATNASSRALKPIGLKARHLNKPSTFAAGVNQLDHWMMSGLLVFADDACNGEPSSPAAAGEVSAKPTEGAFAASDSHPDSACPLGHAGRDSSAASGGARPSIPANASWTDETVSLDARARAYLDANCSHCHSDVGPADTSGLDLRPSVPFGPSYGACKSPIAAGGGSGGRLYDIVPGSPADSIFVYRLETTKPGHMMPELGRSVTHEEGVALIAAWIAAMDGGCS